VFHIVYFQVDMYQCRICEDFEFEGMFRTERNILEQHSGYGWKCPTCRKILGRKRQPHKGCVDGAPSMLHLLVCHRSSAETGAEVERQYQEYRNKDPDSDSAESGQDERAKTF
jgi:hypothetical protein